MDLTNFQMINSSIILIQPDFFLLVKIFIYLFLLHCKFPVKKFQFYYL